MVIEVGRIESSKLDEPLKEEPKGVVKPFLLQAPASPWLRADGAALQLPAGAVV